MRTKLQKAAKPAAGFAAISSLGYPQPQLSIQLLPLVTCLRLAVVSLPERGVGVGVSFTLALPWLAQSQMKRTGICIHPVVAHAEDKHSSRVNMFETDFH